MADRVAIVGAGPVGLFTALVAHAVGLSPRVYEQRSAPLPGSRSIGIHPPSLDLLATLGLLDRFVRAGVEVHRGTAVGASGELGTLAFERGSGRHRFILVVPQDRTEAILERELERRCPGSIVRGARLLSVRSLSRSVSFELEREGAPNEEETASALIACDGKHSKIRSLLGVPFEGRAYEGSYAMGDFVDETPFGSAARIFLGARGLVESFPLPDGRRRWVVRREPGATSSVSSLLDELVATIARRTGERVTTRGASVPSVFRAERYLASALSVGRVALAGDAAHVVSPIGGQGMNLGWLGARSIVSALAATPDSGDAWSRALERDARVRARQASAATRRAEINMWLGRPAPASRDAIVRTLLGDLAQPIIARAFTMRGLSAGI